MNRGEQARATLAHTIGRAPLIAIIFVALVVGGGFVSASVELANNLRLWGVEREDVFEYVSIQYEGIDPEVGLVMSSTRVWHRDVDAASWVDVLVCEGVVISTYPSSTGSAEAEPLDTQPWTYQRKFPTDGRRCVIQSEISATYRGRVFVQRLDSIPFNPTEGDTP